MNRNTWEHVWEECRRWKEGRERGESWQKACKKVLGEEGELDEGIGVGEG